MNRDHLAQVSFDDAPGGAVVAVISGEVDGSNADEVQRAIAERMPTSAVALVVDLSATAYMDSTGVELLFDLARGLSSRRQGFSVVVPPGSGVRRVLELCDVGSVGAMVTSLEEALAGISQPDGGDPEPR